MHRLRLTVFLAGLAFGTVASAQAPARRPVRRAPRPGTAQPAASDAATPTDAAATTTDSTPNSDASAPTDASAAQGSPAGTASNDADAGAGAQTGDAGLPPPPNGTASPTVPADNAPPTTQNNGRGLVALIDTAPMGVDPAAAGIVTDNVRQMLESMGFTTVPTQTLYDAARALHLPFPVPPAGMDALLHALNAPIGITIELQGSGGYYQPTIRVRFAAEPVERYRRLVATQFTLLDSIRGTLPSMLAPPAPPGPAAPGQYPYPTGAPGPLGPYGPPGMPPPGGIGYVPPVQRPRRPTRIHRNPWDVALDAEIAIGPGSGADFFLNYLAGVRVAFFPVDRFGVNLGFSYVNVRGHERNAMTGAVEDVRRNNVLPMVGIETGIDVAPHQHIYLPLRAEIGYLPYNGPVLRLTGALAVPITRDTRIEFDILTPTFWWVPGTTLITLDMGVQLVVGFGRPPPRAHHRTAATQAEGAASSTATGSEPNSPAPATTEAAPGAN